MFRAQYFYAVLVVATDENLPANTQNLVEYEGNKLIVAVDRDKPERIMLETAYGLARIRSLAMHKDDLALDATNLRPVWIATSICGITRIDLRADGFIRVLAINDTRHLTVI